MPKRRAKETIFAFGLAMGATISIAHAETAAQPTGRVLMAQNLTPQQQEEEKRKQEQQKRQQQQHQQRDQGGPQRGQGQDDRQRHQGQGQGQDDRRRQQGQGQGQGQDDRQRLKALEEQQRAKRDAERNQQLKAEEERRRKEAEERLRREQGNKAREKALSDQERNKQFQQDRLKKDAERNQIQPKGTDQNQLKKDADRGERFRKDQDGNVPGVGGARKQVVNPEEHRRELRQRIEKRREADRADGKKRFEEKAISNQDRESYRRARQEFTKEKLKDITSKRQQTKDAAGRVVIVEPDKRRIFRDRNNRPMIQHDENARFKATYRNFREERGPDGKARTIIVRPGGVKIINVMGDDGHLLRRIKVLPDGREFVLINNEYRSHKRRYRDDDRGGGGFGIYIDLPDFEPSIPESEYYVDADQADETEIEDVLTADPLEDLEGDYTLDEVRYSPGIRKRLRKLNLNTVTFEFGSWEVRPEQIERLAVVARVIKRIVEESPDEVFLIAGHTDAVGSDEDNLSLSDRRAESVARVLTDEFGVPPENIVSQGYGETELLVASSGPEERNRRVDFMRITKALAQKNN